MQWLMHCMIVSQHYSGSVEVKAQHVQTELVETEGKLKHVQAGKLLCQQSGSFNFHLQKI